MFIETEAQKNPPPFPAVGWGDRCRSVFVEVGYTFTLQATDQTVIVPVGEELPIPMVSFLVQDPDIIVGCGSAEGFFYHEVIAFASECGGSVHRCGMLIG